MISSIRLLLLLLVLQPLTTMAMQVSQGHLIVHYDFPSQYVQSRTVRVWLPNGYYSNTKQKYPVLYMHDGQMQFDATT